MSPESLGEAGRAELGLGFQAAPTVEITQNARDNPPDISTPFIDQEKKIFLHGALTVFDRVDFSIDPASWINAKIQLIGDSFQVAEKHNFSLAPFASIWHEGDDGRGSGLDYSTEKGFSVAPDVRYHKETTQWRLGLLTGYRLHEHWLIYVGASYQKSKYEGTFDIAGGRKGSFSGEVIARSANVGLEYSSGKKLILRLEDSYSILRIPAYGSKNSQHSFGIVLIAPFSINNIFTADPE